MCGIAGFFLRNGKIEADAGLLEKMLSRIVHRGPEHRGLFAAGHVAIGNQRLKIIDLEGGNQPIYNEDETIVVVYNGELYNFPELKEILLKKGHVFKTRTDTEVLVHLYEEEGPDFVKRLNGIFAFALYDRRRDRLLLGRDRMGIKPLFYHQGRDGLYFASEINALRYLPGFDPALDYQAVAIFLSQFYIPQPWSIYRQARRLEAGHYLFITKDKIENKCYYDPDFSRKSKMTKPEAEEEIIRRLISSVKRQLISDVPVGMFLSSGLDSCSLLAATTLEGQGLTSFTLSFDDRAYDENDVAAARAAFFKSDHHRVVMTEDDFIAGIEERITHLGEPLGPWINVGAEFLSRHARDHGFKVVLNGAGGDELFCGYPTLNAAILSKAYRAVPAWLRGKVIEKVIERLPASEGSLPLTFRLKSFVRALDPSFLRTFFNFKMVIPPAAYQDFLSPQAHEQIKDFSPYLAFEQYLPKIRDLQPIDALQYIDLKVFLEGCVLHLSDNASMSKSLEERLPLLDNEMIDFALTIPVEVKFELFKVKPLLHRALSRYLARFNGADLVSRYKKRGFELPGNKWIRTGRFKDYLKARLAPEKVSRLGFFRPEAVRKTLQDHIDGRQNNERLLQAILGLTHFLETHT